MAKNMLVQKNQGKTISLYSVIVTIICAALITLFLKRCDEPVIASPQIQNSLDSLLEKEKVSELRISSLTKRIVERDSVIASLKNKRSETKVIYRTRVNDVKKLVESNTPECDSLRQAANSLMEVASQYEEQSDSVITHYEIQLGLKDSVIMLRNESVVRLEDGLSVCYSEQHRLNQALLKLAKERKRERWWSIAITAAVGVFILKK